MPLFVDGVEIAEVFVDGIQQDAVFVDGIQVYTGFVFEDYLDNFVDTVGVNIIDHVMDTGQRWELVESTNTVTIMNGTRFSTGQQVAAIRLQGAGRNFTLRPIVTDINPSFVAKLSATWNPFAEGVAPLLQAASINLGAEGNLAQTFCDVIGIFGEYRIALNINGVQDTIGPILTIQAIDITMYYDGTDIAMSGTYYTGTWPSNVAVPFVFPRRSAGGQETVLGRRFTVTSSTSFAGVFVDCEMMSVEEIGMPPGDIPWPAPL